MSDLYSSKAAVGWQTFRENQQKKKTNVALEQAMKAHTVLDGGPFTPEERDPVPIA
jgi:hypothetical protein